MIVAPTPEGLPPNLRFLRLLVTILTATMILGLLAVIWLLVTRLPGATGTGLTLPASITLPEGAKALAFTAGPGWYGVVTTANDILIYDAASGTLRQTLHIAP